MGGILEYFRQLTLGKLILLSLFSLAIAFVLILFLSRFVRDRAVHELARVAIENPLPAVMAEPTRIQQVFQNLLSNAIKYMDKPAGKIRIACSAEGAQWKFSVADNGPGIQPQHFEKIFQLFQTLAPRDRVESSGVGLPRTSATPISTNGTQT